MEVGWFGTFKELKENQTDIIKKLILHIEKNFSVSDSQKIAWEDCINFLMKYIPNICDDIYLAMEYTIPRTSGKRPDILLFFKNKIIILEFKMKPNYKIEDILQVIEYRESLKKYHKETWKNNYSVEAYLILTLNSDINITTQYGVEILNKNNFRKIFLNNKIFMEKISVKNWLDSQYSPLPEVISGAINLFKNRELPEIKSIKDSSLVNTENFIKNIIKNRNGKKQVILVAGVPGAGKTLLGLKFNYFCNEKNISTIYTSGNGPLIDILQYEIGDKALITGILNYLNTYYNQKANPLEEIIIFDEAQRAWDKNKMNKNNLSEVTVLLEVGNKIFKEKNTSTIIALIGFGQEIHNGEENGIKLWLNELSKIEYKDWDFYLPSNLKEFITKNISKKNIYYDNSLFIDTSIRSDFIDTTLFKKYFLKKNLTFDEKEILKNIVNDLYTKGYRIFWTDDLNTVNSYLILLKGKSCLLGSSGVKDEIYKNIFKQNINTHVNTKEAHIWYKNKENTIATEFVIQGLDIDYPVIVFGGDYYLENGSWKISSSIKQSKKYVFSDINKLVGNIYNVLLTRGRKGMLLYFPKEIKYLDELKEFTKEINIIQK